jgi:hypothetical protein
MKMLRKPSPLIVSLFKTSCPSDVARFVVSVIINAINGMPGRRRISDLLIKSCKVFAPFFTDGNASTSVVCIIGSVWIIASVLHSGPSSINFGICRGLSMNIMSFSSSRHRLFKPALSSNICVETSARSRVPTLQISSSNPAIAPALTGAKPITNCFSGLFPSRLELVGRSQPAKSFAT